ncbi:hypothetical protein SM033_00273 [Vibrio phage vB_VpaM_sm033]|nr:hypothetical protein SM033_00273 [Vibrio phage vB_VpaM_sm033]
MQLRNPFLNIIADLLVGDELEKQRLHAKRSIKAIVSLCKSNRFRLTDDLREAIEGVFDINPTATLSFEVHMRNQNGDDMKTAIVDSIAIFVKDE